MELYLLLCAVVLLLCIFSNKISDKIGVPSLLIFMFLGMVFGSEGIFKIEFSDFQAAENICTAALIFIMFYGGYSTNWERAKPAAGRAAVLSTLGVAMTAALVGAFCHFILKLSLPESFLIGSVVSCTDAASVFSIFRSKNLNLEGNLAPLLEIESGSNDPFSYMLTVIALTVMKGGNWILSGKWFSYSWQWVLALARQWGLPDQRLSESLSFAPMDLMRFLYWQRL